MSTQADISQGLKVVVNLRDVRGAQVTAYQAKQHAPLIDLSQNGHYDPSEFWQRIDTSADGRLILEPGQFYILASKKGVRVPPHYAAEMVPFDASIGEYRIHYAGFFDPGFGYGEEGEVKGTPAVLEVRAHEVPFALEDGQLVGRLRYIALVDRPSKVYGGRIGSSYQNQGLALSKQFRRPQV